MPHIKQTITNFFDKIPQVFTRSANNSTSASSGTIPTTPSPPPPNRLADRNRVLNTSTSTRNSDAQPLHAGTSSLSVISNAVINGDAGKIRDEGRKLAKYEFAIEALMAQAMKEEKADLEVKKALADLPGAKPTKLLEIAVRNRDFEFASHLLLNSDAKVLNTQRTILRNKACKDGNFDVIKKLLDQGASLTPKQASGFVGKAVEQRDLPTTTKLLDQGATMSPEQASELLPVAIEVNDTQAALKLVCQGGVANEEQACTLLPHAIQSDDADAVQRLLKQRANPTLLDPAIIEGAGTGMQTLLQQASTVHTLYHAANDGPQATQYTELYKALAGYDFAMARLLLDGGKTSPGMSDTALWRRHGATAADATKRLDIKRAIMVLGDAVTLDKLTTPEGKNLNTPMSKGMGALKDVDPRLLSLYKTHPYRSDKYGDMIHLNGQVDFPDTGKRIQCDTMSTQWLLQRMRSGNKSDYSIFRSEQTLRENFSSDLKDTFRQMRQNPVESHLRKNSEFGHLAADCFRELNKTPPKTGEKERAVHMLITTTNHAMAAELKLRLDEGKTSYVLHVYDPNSSVGDRRVAFNNLKDLEGINFEDMTPTRNESTAYWGDNPDNHHSTFRIVSDPASQQEDVSAGGKVKKLTTRSDFLSPDMFKELVAEGFVHDFQEMLPRIKEHLNTLNTKEKIAFLEASIDDAPAIQLACAKGYATVLPYFQLVLETDLPLAEKTRLLGGHTQKGGPSALSKADLHPQLVRQVLDLLLASDLPVENKQTLFGAVDKKGMPLIAYALTREGKEDLVAALCDAVLQSPLTDGDKEELLSLVCNNRPVFYFAAQLGNRNGAETFCRRVLESGLPDYAKVNLVSGQFLSSEPAMHAAAKQGHVETAAGICDQVLASTLGGHDKFELLQKRDAKSQTLLMTTAAQAEKPKMAELAAHLYDSVLNAESGLSVQEKIDIVSNKYKGYTPLMLAVLNKQHDLLEKFGNALAANTDLSSEQKLALFAPHTGNKPDLTHLAPTAEMVAAYERTAEKLGVKNEPGVAETLAQWKRVLAATISNETREQVKASVLAGLTQWDYDKDAQYVNRTSPMGQDHKLLALMMDALYTHHFQNAFTLDAVPDDEALKDLCRHALQDVPEQFKETADKLISNFAPRAKETMQILEKHYAALPHLQDLAPENRWRTLVDPIKIDMLAQHGINPDNPMLAFIFDADAGYANKSARGWVAAAQHIEAATPISVDLLKALHNAGSGAGYTAEQGTQLFEGAYTADGLKALAGLMQRLADENEVVTFAQIGNELFWMNESEAMTATIPPGGSFQQTLEAIEEADLDPSEKPMEELLQDAATKAGMSEAQPTVVTGFHRLGTPHKTLDRVHDAVIGKFRQDAGNATTSDEKILASNTMYFDGHHTHGFEDGNGRLWSRDMFNTSLAQQGESLAVFYDPWRSKGQSPQELLATTRDAQNRWHSWLKPEAKQS